MKEEELTNKFKNCYKTKYPDKFIFIGKPNQSTYADCELEYENKYIKLEAKVFSNRSSSSIDFSKIFGQVLKNRKSNPIYNKNNYDIEYGFLFNLEDIEYIKNKIKKEFIKNDLIKFGKHFKVKNVFIYDYINDNFKLKDWNDFIK